MTEVRVNAAVLRVELSDLVRHTEWGLRGEAARFVDAARRAIPLLNGDFPRDAVPILDAALMLSLEVGREVSAHDDALWRRVWLAWTRFRLCVGMV